MVASDHYCSTMSLLACYFCQKFLKSRPRWWADSMKAAQGKFQDLQVARLPERWLVVQRSCTVTRCAARKAAASHHMGCAHSCILSPYM